MKILKPHPTITKTRGYAERFVERFGFLKKYGFSLSMHQRRGASGREEWYVTIERESDSVAGCPNLGEYLASIYFPVEMIERGDCDFISGDLDQSGYGQTSQSYTYATGAMTIATLFG